MHIDSQIQAAELKGKIQQLWAVSAQKIDEIYKASQKNYGSPVCTVEGEYTSRGWTEWTQGFLHGSALLQFDATGDEAFLNLARDRIIKTMAPNISHMGVHDHGFQNVSTYGNLLRLMGENKIPSDRWEQRFYELALKLSGAIQASRWTGLPDHLGFVYSFNGPHSLFADTIRTMRVLGLSHLLGHVLMGEQDARINLLERMLCHMETTARYTMYYGEDRDTYDVRGRVAHESVFNLNNGSYRCPNTQQGYSPFSTWTRGLAWVLLGFAEQIEFLNSLSEKSYRSLNAGGLTGKKQILRRFLDTTKAAADFYIENTPTDGIPYWDTGAPGLAEMGDYLNRSADPFNEHEPVDSSAATIAGQGLLRLGHFLHESGDSKGGERYHQAGLTVTNALISEPYISLESSHQGLILHSVYHRPNGWDHIPAGRNVPCGESSMWGDYHMRELMVTIQRLISGKPYHTFFNGIIPNLK